MKPNYHPHHPSCRTFGRQLLTETERDDLCTCKTRYLKHEEQLLRELRSFCELQILTRSKPHSEMKRIIDALNANDQAFARPPE